MPQVAHRRAAPCADVAERTRMPPAAASGYDDPTLAWLYCRRQCRTHGPAHAQALWAVGGGPQMWQTRRHAAVMQLCSTQSCKAPQPAPTKLCRHHALCGVLRSAFACVLVRQASGVGCTPAMGMECRSAWIYAHERVDPLACAAPIIALHAWSTTVGAVAVADVRSTLERQCTSCAHEYGVSPARRGAHAHRGSLVRCAV